jgi:hypothetical protein
VRTAPELTPKASAAALPVRDEGAHLAFAGGSVDLFDTGPRTSMSDAGIDSVPATYGIFEIEDTVKVWDEYPT